MNITEELNQIIINNQLDRYYPRFRMKIQAEKIIEEIARNMNANAKVMLVGTSGEEVDYTKDLIGKYRQVKGLFISPNIEADHNIWNELKQADKVYLVSFHKMEQAMKMLEDHQINFENLYDIFLCEDLIFEDKFYNIFVNSYEDVKLEGHNSSLWKKRGSCQLEYFFLKKRYESAADPKLKNIFLEKMLFLTLYAKNFLEAEKCIQEIQNNGENKNIKAAWREITLLLEEIREKLLQRKENDVVWFWMDNVSFDEAEEMTYLNSMKEKSLSFSNAFTNMPYTNPTFRAAVCQKRGVVDQSYKIEVVDDNSSEMLSFLEENGYHIIMISRDFKTYASVKNRLDFYDSTSINFWEILECLSDMNKKYFILVHSTIETHFPWLSFRMRSLSNFHEMSHYGKQELDEQMEFYGSFFNKEVMQIFMSDHGWPNGDFLKCHHIHMDIYHCDIKPQKIDDLFSILDFYPLIRQLIVEKKIDPKTFRREYVSIENLDRYNAADVEAMFKDKTIDLIRCFGYVGVISKDEIYVRFSIGNEYQHNRGRGSWRPFICLESEIENDDHLEILRQKADIYPIEILKEEKFKYSRYLHKIYETYRIRSKELIKALNTYLSDILSDYDDGSVAIRTGGTHSYYLYAILAENVQRKIGTFIDYTSQCLCAVYDKRIIRKESLVEEDIKAVILSSYIYRDQLKEEAINYPTLINVIDIYDVFEQIGYCFKNDFFGTMGLQEEDYDAVYKP